MKNVEKKVREAEFFLMKMRQQESPTSGDREPFDFYHSAFLNAADAVWARFRVVGLLRCVTLVPPSCTRC
jgi:hypothetical protein